jgi:O-antigen/teichoic acid export membrane protein
MLVAVAVSAAIALGSSHDRETRLVVLAVAGCKAVEGVSDVYYGGLHQVERMRPIAVALIWRGVLGILALGAVLWAGGGLLTAIAALGAVWLAVLLAHTLPAVASLLRARGERVAPRLLWRTAGQIAAVALPLGLVNMLVSLRANVPRYFVEGYGGAAELGVFAALSSLVVAGSLVVGALGQSATPRLARYHFEGHLAAFRRLLAWLLAFAGVIGIAGVALAAVAGRPVLGLLFGPAYETRAEVLVWLMAAGCVSYASSFLGFALTAARRFRVQVPLFAATAVACAATCWWLVPRRGLTGAAWGWGTSFLLELVAMAAILWVALRRSPVRE